jgi:hypothetical protein
MAEDNTIEVFVYTEGAVVPENVVRVRIDPTVLVIPDISANAFASRINLEEVELHDGIREIGLGAFGGCRALNVLQLSDRVEIIGEGAFESCTFTKFRSPPLVTTITRGMLVHCNNLLSLELPKNIIEVKGFAFVSCYSLRNIALASNTVIDERAFNNCSDLLQIFDGLYELVNALRLRFNGLPIHSKLYYISYYDQMTAEEFLNTIVIGKNGELDPSGMHQDCLGMTVLHILACSTVQCLELYQLMIEKYPANLIVEDAWDALPLLYAIWGDAPSEIIEFLVNSYQSLYPAHEFDWSNMVITLGKANASKEVIQNLLDVQLTLSPGYNIDWDSILGVLAERTARYEPHASPKTFCFLTRCCIATRVKAIGVEHFRNDMDDDWMGYDKYKLNRQAWHDETLTKLEYYESEYRRLKEMTSLLELAMWKTRMDDARTILDQGETIGGGNKRMKMDPSDFRLHCRISCGADHVVENVWPYLLPPDYVRSYVPDEDDNDENGSDDDDDY